MRLLIVEGEPRLAARVARGLREEGFAEDTVRTTAAARDRTAVTAYDLVLLDWGLPDGSGVELLRRWRDEGLAVPVLILPARDLLDDKIAGLDAGADGYLTKPFAFEELLARTKARLRPPGRAQSSPSRARPRVSPESSPSAAGPAPRSSMHRRPPRFRCGCA